RSDLQATEEPFTEPTRSWNRSLTHIDPTILQRLLQQSHFFPEIFGLLPQCLPLLFKLPLSGREALLLLFALPCALCLFLAQRLPQSLTLGMSTLQILFGRP